MDFCCKFAYLHGGASGGHGGAARGHGGAARGHVGISACSQCGVGKLCFYERDKVL